MKGKARLGSVQKAPKVQRDELDDNIATYQLDADGRSSEEQLRYVRLDRIEPSPFQIRRVFPQTDIEELADSIRDNGLVHAPKGRAHPTRSGWVELMPGEMRKRALQRLVERGEAESVLKKDREGNWLAPIVLVTMGDDRAEAIVFAENEARTDLSPWEWSLAWQQRRDRRKERGEAATVRDVAAAHKKPHTTVGEYLRVADAISLSVIDRAGAMGQGGPDHSQMALLPFSSLKGIAVSAGLGVEQGSQHLKEELRRAKKRVDTARRGLAKTAPRTATSRPGSFQINIRQPLPDLTPQQATHYLGRISEALPVLASRATENIDPGDASNLATVLEQVAGLLRQPVNG